MSDFGDQSDTLDEGQIFRAVYDKSKVALRTLAHSSLVPEDYDQISLSYISSGNGTGEVGVVTYKKATVVVAILSLTYDSENRIIDVLRM